SYGRFVQGVVCRYGAAGDVGSSVPGLAWVLMEADYVVGISRALGGSGDPSPVTAFGTFQGIRAALKWSTGNDSLHGRTVAIQGLGHVGYHLVKLVTEAGARAVVADIFEDAIQRVIIDFANMVDVVPPAEIHAAACDVFAPCALGAVINDDTIPQLKCQIVCGSANNILADEDKHARALEQKGILYAPDYVVNAGGLINVANELEGYNHERALQQAGGIYDITTQIFQIARTEETTTVQAANALAERRITGAGKLRDRFVSRRPARMMRNMRTDI
ncbi:MAG: leucine dehydrogenase, partial [Myxococcales bacterium]|nr:leucine dehydrogenase [Myxococcales bacterium]